MNVTWDPCLKIETMETVKGNGWEVKDHTLNKVYYVL